MLSQKMSYLKSLDRQERLLLRIFRSLNTFEKSFKNKMLKNQEKYPVEKAFGNATKYTDL